MPRRGLLAFLLAWALAAGAAAGQAQERADTVPGTVSGTVFGRFQGARTPLGFATIQALAPGLRRSVVADSLGHYTLVGLPAGPVRLQVTHPGHHPLTLEVTVPGRSPLRVDLELGGRPVELPPVDVSRNPRIPDPEGRAVDAASLSRVEALALEAGVGVGIPGLVEAVRGIPGNDPANPTDVLFMRGSTTDMKLVLLNGAPVFTPFHVAGLLSSFEPSVLDRATLHVGGAPARYDGGLTYILDLGVRRPRRDRPRLSGAVDLLSGSVGMEAPLGGSAGMLFSGRTLHNLGDGPLGGVSPYGYADALVGVEVEPGRGHVLSATGFWNRESVRLDFDAPTPREIRDGAWWSNRSGGLNYRGSLGDLTADVTVAASRYDATLPLLPGITEEDPDPAPLLATATNDRVRIVAEVANPTDRGTSRVGISYETQDGTYDARRLFEVGEGTRTAASAQVLGAYVDVSRTLTPAVSVRLGARLDDFSGRNGGVRFAPRGSLTWTVAPSAFLTVAAGRYHQHARTTDVEVERALTEVVTEEITGSSLLPVATADHVVLSLDQGFGERTRLGLQGFWKRYEGLPGAGDGTVRSSGLDLRLRSLGEDVTVWLGYGLSWFWSGDGLGTSSDFSGRHLLSAGASGTLVGPLEGAARVAYGAGLPYTAIPFGRSEDALSATDTPTRPQETAPPLAGGLDEEFLRLDLEIHAVLTPQWGGRTWELRPYLRILNALDRRDALFYTFQPWRDDAVRPLAQRPLLPVVGIAWTF